MRKVADVYLEVHKDTLQWGRNLIVAEGRHHGAGNDARAASMGPQLDSCGREEAAEIGRYLVELQWGRNLIVAEGMSHDSDFVAYVRLQWGRNLIVAEG